MARGLDFEEPLVELEKKITELKNIAREKNLNLEKEIKQLEAESLQIKKKIYLSLTPWQKVQLARHPTRPSAEDYINLMMTDFIELKGDRLFAEDFAIISGIAKLDEHSVVVIGFRKGRTLEENIKRNFGMAHPEGYRKSLRLIQLGEKFSLPVIIFIDTPGAYPGIGAEERGQGNSIAQNLRAMTLIKTPILITITGEGGSGGALALGVGDRILMLEHAVYSVISPEGCAAILWKDGKKAKEAAQALRLTAADLLELRVIDEIVKEPLGGAQRDKEKMAADLKRTLLKHLNTLAKIPLPTLLQHRYQKFRRIGKWKEAKIPKRTGREGKLRESS